MNLSIELLIVYLPSSIHPVHDQTGVTEDLHPKPIGPSRTPSSELGSFLHNPPLSQILNFLPKASLTCFSSFFISLLHIFSVVLTKLTHSLSDSHHLLGALHFVIRLYLLVYTTPIHLLFIFLLLLVIQNLNLRRSVPSTQVGMHQKVPHQVISRLRPLGLQKPASCTSKFAATS